jgi:hypothetical protein
MHLRVVAYSPVRNIFSLEKCFSRQILEGINFNAELVLRGFIIDSGGYVILKKSVLKIELYALIDMLYS